MPRPTTLLILGLLAVNSVIGLAYAWPAVVETPMAVIAHRGDVAGWPENTQEAIVAARDSAADGIEFDVLQSADGTWWLAHDTQLEFTTTGAGPIREASDRVLDDLRIDGGFGFDPARHLHLGMVRLDTVLDDLAGYEGTVIVDLKDKTLAAHTALAEVLTGRGRQTAYVICRTLEGASAVKAVDPRFTTILLSDAVGHPDVDVWLLDAEAGVKWPRTTLTDAAGTIGMAFIREVDEEAALANGRRWGVAFVISNDIGRSLTWRDGVSSLATR